MAVTTPTTHTRAARPTRRRAPARSSFYRVNELTLLDWFCGAGGSTQGIAAIRDRDGRRVVRPVHAANHWDLAIESHAANFPDVDHWKGDIRAIDVGTLPYASLAWMSPECTFWSQARGEQRTYDRDADTLPGLEEPLPPEAAERSRALMEEVPLYLRAMVRRGRPVLAGVVENVVDVRKWVDFDRWVKAIESLGYKTRLIALNSMHANAVNTPRAPQSRDRFYLAYWHVSLKRDPDWDRWLRPPAWCPVCEKPVRAIQTWKKAGQDMGKYGAKTGQYFYRCPKVHGTRTGALPIEPYFAPAIQAIDFSIPGIRIGDREKHGKVPLKPKTLARIKGGIERHWGRPIVVEAAGNTYDTSDPKHPQHGDPNGYLRAWPADSEPLKVLTTVETRGIATPPLMVPVEGRDGLSARSSIDALRSQTARAETGVAMLPGTADLPFIAELRGGGSDTRSAGEPLATVTASGNHHGLVTPPLLTPAGGTWNDAALPVTQPMRARTTRETEGIVVPPGFVMRNNEGGAEMCTPFDEPMRTLTTKGHQSVVTWSPDTLYSYDTGRVAGLAGNALPTQTGIDGDAAMQAAVSVEDCLFRMLEPDEIGAGMAFVKGYTVLGNRREQVRQYGNAVTPPAAEVLMSALIECITGEKLPDPWMPGDLHTAA